MMMLWIWHLCLYYFLLYIHIYIRIGKFIEGNQDVAFLPSQASFPTTFVKNCGRGKSFANATSHKTLVG